MGRIIQSSNFVKTPVLLFQEKVGSSFTGTLKNKKPGSIGQIFELVYDEGDVLAGLSTGNKDEKGRIIYEECKVNAGDVVALFGNTQLDDKVGAQVNIGERVKITYKGLVSNPKSKRKYNDYVVEVL